MSETVNDKAQFAKCVYVEYKKCSRKRGQHPVVPFSYIINHKGMLFTVIQL